MANPTKIKLHKQEILEIHWNNNNVFHYPLKFLRDESPDAGNKGETILWQHYSPPDQGPDKPGKYEIHKIDTVGNYAIKITWKDGYDYGLYSWDLLQRWGEFLEVKNGLSKDSSEEDKQV